MEVGYISHLVVLLSNVLVSNPSKKAVTWHWNRCHCSSAKLVFSLSFFFCAWDRLLPKKIEVGEESPGEIQTFTAHTTKRHRSGKHCCISRSQPAGLGACRQSCRQLPLLLGLGKLIRPENCQVCSEGTGEGSCEVWRKFKPPSFFFFLKFVDCEKLTWASTCKMLSNNKVGWGWPSQEIQWWSAGPGQLPLAEIFWNPDWMLKFPAGVKLATGAHSVLLLHRH